MNNKFILTMMMALIMLSLVSAEQDSLGTYKQGEDITLLQICGTCSYNNITSIVLPNSTHLPIDTAMTKRGMEYTYTFSETNSPGTYLVNGFGDLDGTDNAWAYDFDVTGTGQAFGLEKSIFYVGVMAVLSFLFIVTVAGIGFLPGGDTRDEEGTLMEVNWLKHLKLPLMGVAHGFLVMISYLGMNVAQAYLETGLVTMIFRVIFTFLMISITIAVPIILVYTIVKLIQDYVVKDLLSRGLYSDG